MSNNVLMFCNKVFKKEFKDYRELRAYLKGINKIEEKVSIVSAIVNDIIHNIVDDDDFELWERDRIYSNMSSETVEWLKSIGVTADKKGTYEYKYSLDKNLYSENNIKFLHDLVHTFMNDRRYSRESKTYIITAVEEFIRWFATSQNTNSIYMDAYNYKDDYYDWDDEDDDYDKVEEEIDSELEVQINEYIGSNDSFISTIEWRQNEHLNAYMDYFEILLNAIGAEYTKEFEHSFSTIYTCEAEDWEDPAEYGVDEIATHRVEVKYKIEF